MEGIASQISPVRHSSVVDNDTRSEMLSLRDSRYETPQKDHVTANQLRYLQTGKLEKETIRDYITASRQYLQKSIAREDKKRDLSKTSAKYEAEKKKLKQAKISFEDDMQRYQSMKTEMEHMSLVQSE